MLMLLRGHAAYAWASAGHIWKPMGMSKRTACRTGRLTTLSLEMFERDVQGVMDEYLAGSIAERDLQRVSSLLGS